MSALGAMRAELAIGPMTAPELAAVLEISPRLASARVCALVQLGQAHIVGSFPNDLDQPQQIYDLTPKGRRMAIDETKSVHNVPVNSGAHRDRMRPKGPVSGAKNANKTRNSASSDPFRYGVPPADPGVIFEDDRLLERTA